MSTQNRAVQQNILHIWVVDEVLMHFLQNFVVTPVGKAIVNLYSNHHISPVACATGPTVASRKYFHKQPTFGFFTYINAGM